MKLKKVKLIEVEIEDFECDEETMLFRFARLMEKRFNVEMTLDIRLKDRSVTAYGYFKYNKATGKKQIILYRRNRYFEYSKDWLFSVFIHEFIHYYQHEHVEGWVRKKGVMHDRQFYELLNRELEYFKEKGLLKNAEYSKGYFEYTQSLL